MGIENFQLYDYFSPIAEDSIKKTFVVSTVAHVLFFSIAIFGAPIFSKLFPSHFIRIGGGGGIGDAIHVQAVQDLPGLKLPPPEQPTQSKIASENPGLYQPPEQPQVEVKRNQQTQVQDDKAVALAELKSLRQKQRQQQRRQNLPQPPNAVDYGRGGQPDFNYGEFRAGGAGSGGVGFEGGFGDRYAWYARAIIQRISSNFEEQMVGSILHEAPRVFVTFLISRDGSVSNIVLENSSGIPAFDAMAVRSIQSSSPMPPLPGDFPGSRIRVECYFDFHR